MAKPTEYDLLLSIDSQLKTLASKGVSVDFTPVLSAIANVQTTANAILADNEPSEGAPVITGISPTSGSVNGGDTITLTGSNFTNANGVKFGLVDGQNLVVQNDATATIQAPAQAAGTVDITITNPAGTSAVSAADKYTFA